MDDPLLTPVDPAEADPLLTPVPPEQADPLLVPISPEQADPLLTPISPEQADPLLTPISPEQADPLLIPIASPRPNSLVNSPLFSQSLIPDTSTTTVPSFSLQTSGTQTSSEPPINQAIGPKVEDFLLKERAPLMRTQEEIRTQISKLNPLLQKANPNFNPNDLMTTIPFKGGTRLPVPTPRAVAGAINTFLVPNNVLGASLEALPLVTEAIGPALSKMGEAESAISKTASRVSKAIESGEMTVDKLADHLAELKKASLPLGNQPPIIKPLIGEDGGETLKNIVSRGTRTRLDAEQALLGLDKNLNPLMKATADEALRKLKSGEIPMPSEIRSVSHWLSEAYDSGEIDGSFVAKAMSNPKIAEVLESSDPETKALARGLIERSASSLGYGLGTLGQLGKKFAALTDADPEAKAIYDKITKKGVTGGIYSRLMEPIRWLESARRSLMVDRLSLAIRDYLSHGARYSLGVMEDSLNGFFGAVSGKIAAKDADVFLDQDVSSLASQVSKGRKISSDIQNILDKYPTEAAKLATSPYAELSLPHKAGRFLNAIHSASFNFYTKAYLDAGLRSEAFLQGIPIEQLGRDSVARVIEKARELTFSKSFKDSFFGDILKLYRDNPWMTAVGQTFPRFWANAAKTFYDFSPLPLFNPTTYLKMADPDPRIAFGAINRAWLGTRIISAGMALNKMGLMDKNYYELKTGTDPKTGRDVYTDLRRFYPLSAPALIGALLDKAVQSHQYAKSQGLSEEEQNNAALSPLMKLTGQDWSAFLLNLRRVDFSGVQILDAGLSTSESTGVKHLKDSLSNFFGQYAASFIPPILTNTPMSFMAHFDPQYAIIRNTKGDPIWDPIKNRFPGSKQLLPPSYPPVGPGPSKIESPIIQEITGQVLRDYTKPQIELDRLGIPYKDLLPKTGDSIYNNNVNKYVGGYIDQVLSQIINTRGYMLLSDSQKKKIVMSKVHEFQRAGKQIALQDLSPEDFIRQVEKGKKEIKEEEFEKSLNESSTP